MAWLIAKKAVVCILPKFISVERLDRWAHAHMDKLPRQRFLTREVGVTRDADGHMGRNLAVVATSFFLLLASGCTKQDPYSPPDIFYYFASYKVGKNPTTVTPTDVNQDGFTDLVTTNIGSNTLSILLGNGDGTFHDQVQLNVCKEPARSLSECSTAMRIPMWCWPAQGATKWPYFSGGSMENLKKGRAIPCIGRLLPLPATI